MRTPSEQFIDSKNAEKAQPIHLFRIQIDLDDPQYDLFYAAYPETVSFYKDDDSVSAGYSAQDYSPFPIKVEDYEENAKGEITGLTVVVSNVTRLIESYLVNYDGLKNRRVTVRQVFADKLTTPTAYIEDVFYIDSCVATDMAVSFRLQSKLDVQDVKLPYRTFNRDYCRWRYRGYGCFISDGAGGWTEPVNFSQDTTNLIVAERIKAKSSNYGGGDPPYYYVTASFKRKRIPQLTKTNLSQMLLSIKIENLHTVTGLYLEIGSVRGDSGEGNEGWRSPDILGSFSFVEGTWEACTVDLTGWSSLSQDLNTSRIKRVSLYVERSVSGDVTTVSWKNAKLRVLESILFEATDPDTCNKSLLDCERHNNQGRFGGFPSIPTRRYG